MEDPLIDLTLVKPFGGPNDLGFFFIVLFPSLIIDILLGKFVLIVVPTVLCSSPTACETEDWEHMGIVGAFPGQRMNRFV